MKPLFTEKEVTDDAFFEALAERVRDLDVITCSEWCQGLRYTLRSAGSVFIAIIEPELHEGEIWHHLSVSVARPPRVPTWDELGQMKRVFLGDAKAVMVFPSKREYVNDHPHVLHLFSGPDGLPDFRSEFTVNGRPSI